MKEYTCIVCPAGCSISVDDHGNITGNKCKRGYEYVLSESTNPVRTVTSTVATDCGTRCPVRTAAPVPKDSMSEVMKIVRGVVAKTPVKLGEIIVPDIAGTGVDLIATGEA